MALMVSSGFGADIVSAAVRALYNRALQEQSAELYYQELGLTQYSPDVPAEQLSGVTGPGRGILTIEGQQYGSNDKTRGYPVTLTMRKYTSELSWTEEDIHWINKASSSSKRAMELKDMASEKVQALNQNINEDTCKVFYLGFGSTFLVNGIGNSEALYASHTLRKTQTTQKNTFATADGHLPLSSSALEKAITIMNRFKAHNGNQLLRVRNLKLIVPAELIATANKIIWSDYGPDVANLGLQISSKTSLAKRGITIEAVEAPDITSSYSTYWFLVDTKRAARRAFMAWGWKPRMNDVNEYEKGTYKNEASTLFGPFIHGWQWTFGSKGDASAS